MTRRAALLAALVGCAAPLAAQSATGVRVGVVPDTVLVGERFLAGVSVPAAPGERVEVAFDSSARHETLAPVRVSTLDADGRVRIDATLVAWTTGADTARATVRVVAPDGRTRVLPVVLPLPFVRTTLPADSTRPRDPKDVLDPPSRFRWTWIAAVVLAALLALAVWRWRRRRGSRLSTTSTDPRAHALDELDRLRAAPLSDAADVEALYVGTSRVLRRFAARVDPGLGRDLTTREWLARLSTADAPSADVAAVADALAAADLAKFARRVPSPARAVADWEAARAWVASSPSSVRSPDDDHAEDAEETEEDAEGTVSPRPLRGPPRPLRDAVPGEHTEEG